MAGVREINYSGLQEVQGLPKAISVFPNLTKYEIARHQAYEDSTESYCLVVHIGVS